MFLPCVSGIITALDTATILVSRCRCSVVDMLVQAHLC